MKKRVLSLAMILLLCLGLTVQASAYSVSKIRGENIVSAGNAHTGLIDAKGCLWMWGYNNYGQLGNGSTKSSLVPIKVLNNVLSVSCGDSHTAAIKTDRSLWMWGNNTSGQLGNGSKKNALVPIKVLDNVVDVSCRGDYTAAVKDDGSLWTWGTNNDMQLGNGGVGNTHDENYGTYQTVPVKVMDNVAAVSCGNDRAAAIKTDGSLWWWGYSSVAISEGGTTYLGGSYQSVPIKIMENVVTVSSGASHTAAVKTDGSLWTWGDNSYGQLGSNSVMESAVPVKVLDGVSTVSCGNGSTVAVKTDGSLWVWGDNEFGELGSSIGNAKVPYYNTVSASYDSFPVQTIPLKLMDGVASAGCGTLYTIIVKTDGSVWACGKNEIGQLGNDGKHNVNKDGFAIQTTPVKISFSAASVISNTPPTISNNVKIDTGKTLTVKAGRTYRFKLTANSKPTFVSGNTKVFSVIYKGHTGNDYFYEVKAIGKIAQGAGFYLNGSKTPVTVGTIG